jgi:hypothetical protein
MNTVAQVLARFRRDLNLTAAAKGRLPGSAYTDRGDAGAKVKDAFPRDGPSYSVTLS